MDFSGRGRALAPVDRPTEHSASLRERPALSPGPLEGTFWKMGQQSWPLEPSLPILRPAPPGRNNHSLFFVKYLAFFLL